MNQRINPQKLAVVFISLFLFFQNFNSFSNDGMWLPLFLKDYNEADMQKNGLKISAEDIYSINKTSLKDAVLLFGGGCTGEVISENGLILTNHHCGFWQIQSHSTLQNNYIEDGFWAMSKKEELTNTGLEVTFLKSITDVTDDVLKGVNNNVNEGQRKAIIDSNIIKIKKTAIDSISHYNISVKPFFHGNQYFMFITETFRDVRLVGAPPKSIGNFGGDTDNWMWPRHSADFALFRIYADSNNMPAEYSVNNIPYKPKKHFNISLKGVKEGDFTMVYGFPGRTQEYIPSYGVKMVVEDHNPDLIKIRRTRLDVWEMFMKDNDTMKINYASKHARVSNYWKKWIGESKGLKRFDAISKKQEFEKGFQEWANVDIDRKNEYGLLLPSFEKVYSNYSEKKEWVNYYIEGLFGVEMNDFVWDFTVFHSSNQMSIEDLNSHKENLRLRSKSFYAKTNIEADKLIYKRILKLFKENVPTNLHPTFFKEICIKYNNNFDKYIEDVYSESQFSSLEKVTSFIDKYKLKSCKKLNKDPLYKLIMSFYRFYASQIHTELSSNKRSLDSLQRIYMNGILEYDNDLLYPDANATLRIAYGNVNGYSPRNAIKYSYYTTLNGVMMKEDPDIEDYYVPKKLKELYNRKDYGIYGTDSTMIVCFVASNHTSGGNSGSPVLNAEGELIGINFDRVWEGTMSDIMFDEDYCRNISVDIRYVLFIIDKYANAGYLIDEMSIVK